MLIKTTGQGDAQLRLLYEQEYDRLVRLAGLLGARDPEDVVQTAFERSVTKLPSLRGQSAGTAYLRAVVANTVRSEHRRRSVISRRSSHDAAASDRYVASAEDDALASRASVDLIRLIRALPSRQREIVVFRYWLDQSPEQIASELGLPVGTVKSHISRALARIRAELPEVDQQ